MGLTLLSLGPAQAQYYDFRRDTEAETYLAGLRSKLSKAELKDLNEGYLLELARTLGQLDRLSIPDRVVIDHLKAAVEVKDRYYGTNRDDLFLPYILPIRVRFEGTSHSEWRPLLRSRLAEEAPALVGQAGPDAVTILAWTAKQVKLIEPYETYRLNLKGDVDPLSVLRSGYGTEIDVAILGVAALRSEGIAARIAYAPTLRGHDGGKLWLEYLVGDRWVPWVPSGPLGKDHAAFIREKYGKAVSIIVVNPADPENVTPNYIEGLTRLYVSPVPFQSPAFEYSLMVAERDRLAPLMGRDIYSIFPKGMEKGIAPGTYYIASGARPQFAALRMVTLEAGETGWYMVSMESGKDDFTKSPTKPTAFPYDPKG